MNKILFLSYGLEFFGELSHYKGIYVVDYRPAYEINHSRSYFGIAPSLTFNLKFEDRIVFFIDTRFRYGRVNLIQRESTLINKDLYPDREYWTSVFDPINSIGLKFKL